MKTHLPNRSSLLTATALLGVSLVAVFAVTRYRAEPSPLTPQETHEATAAINAIKPGSQIRNLRRDSDRNIRAFLPGNPLGGQIILVTQNRGEWKAAIEVDCF